MHLATASRKKPKKGREKTEFKTDENEKEAIKIV